MIVLDTNVLSELMKTSPDPRVAAWLQALDATSLAVSTVTIAEIAYGLARLPAGRRRDDLVSGFEGLLEALSIVALDDAAAREAGRLRALREAAGLASSPSDMMIAGCVSAAGASLATRNLRDFAGLDLEVLDPWAG
jgi:predicted nucleic acid-binding protein